MTDFRALCAELVELLEDEWYGVTREPSALVNARAALAQPEPQGPSELELEAIELKLWDKHRTKGYMGEEFMYDNDFSAALDEYRDLLARPEPQGPTDAELDALFTEVDQGGECQSWRAFARAVLARWGTPATTGEQQ
jgi:hypothetical protein